MKHAFTLLLYVLALPAQAFSITDYKVSIHINADSSLQVVEDITADFSQDPRHGIYRRIPIALMDRLQNKIALRLDLQSVTDENGISHKFLVKKDGAHFKIRIGDPDVTVDLPVRYRITYGIQRAVRYFDDHDELYWNAIGHDSEVPILQAACRVVLPADVAAARLQAACFIGALGSKEAGPQAARTPNSVSFTDIRPLQIGEGVTIVVGWPKGITRQPSAQQATLWFIQDNQHFLIPVFVLVVMLLIVWKHGRDAQVSQSVAVQYGPPDNISPTEMGVLIDEKLDARDVTAAIFDLAVRGYLRIEEDESKMFFGLFRNTDYRFAKVAGADKTKLSAFDKHLLEAIFPSVDTRMLSDMKNEFYVHIPILRKHTMKSLLDRGYFSSDPKTVQGTWAVIGILVALAIILPVALIRAKLSPLMIATGVVSGLIVIVLGQFMPRKTALGARALNQVKGFEEYLQRAEVQELDTAEARGLFEKFLPYATVLNVGEKWARKFNGLYTQPPDWYTGTSGFHNGVFYPHLFANSLHSANNSFAQVASSVPRSAGSGWSSGGSGFSGGGFSGGGAGGGGVGGW